MMTCLAILLGLPLVATLIALFDDDGPVGPRPEVAVLVSAWATWSFMPHAERRAERP
jgi:hypothetical protein